MLLPLLLHMCQFTPSYVSILSSPIFTATSFNSSSLFRSQQNILSITLESIVYLLLLRPNQELLDLLSYLNCSVLGSYFYILVFYPLQFCLLFLYSYNSWPNIQISHSFSNFCSLCLCSWHIGCVV